MRNPTTGEPFNKKTVYDRVFKTHCHDGDAADPWKHQPALSRTAGVPSLMAERLAWARRELSEERGAGGYHRHVLWLDPQNHILPRPRRKRRNKPRLGRGKRGG